MQPNGAFRDCNKDVVLDIEGELAFWKTAYVDSAFHSPLRPFDAFIPTLKFGYDMYLLNHRRSLDELLPAFQKRYPLDVPQYSRLEWPLAETVVRETWKRMKPHRPLTPVRDSTASGMRAS